MWKISLGYDEITELPPKSAQLLAGFLSIADGSITHPNDATRFYKFIRHCHAKSVNLPSETLRTILKRYGCENEQAERLSRIYHHGRNILKV